MTVIIITEFNAHYASRTGMEHQIPSMIHAINPSMSELHNIYFHAYKLVFQPNLNVNNEKTGTNYENSLYFYPYRLPHTFAETLCTRHLAYPISLFLMAQE